MASNASRSLCRLASTRAAVSGPARTRLAARSTLRYQSTQAQASNHTPAIVGGLAGGSAVFLGGYLWYHFSGVKTGVNTIHQAKSQLDNAINHLKSATKQDLKPDETIQWLRSTAMAYAGFIPGAKGVLDKTFDSLDQIKGQHGEELKEITNNSYQDLKGLTEKGGLDLGTAKEAWDILSEAARKIEQLAEKAGKDILENHPEIKEKYGKQINKIKQMSESGGGEAKKYADEVYDKIKNSIMTGNFASIGGIVEEGFSKVQGFGDEAWNKAYEQAKPYLEKNPEVKKLVDENMDKLKNSDFGGLIKQVQEAAKSGDTGKLQEWAQKQVGQLQGMSDEAWRGAMAKASIYVDKYPELKKLMENKSDALRKVDFEEVMKRLREARDSGDIKPVKEYIEKEADRIQKS